MIIKTMKLIFVTTKAACFFHMQGLLSGASLRTLFSPFGSSALAVDRCHLRRGSENQIESQGQSTKQNHLEIPKDFINTEHSNVLGLRGFICFTFSALSHLHTWCYGKEGENFFPRGQGDPILYSLNHTPHYTHAHTIELLTGFLEAGAPVGRALDLVSKTLGLILALLSNISVTVGQSCNLSETQFSFL